MVVVEVPKRWDHEADVIVVGGGTAGLPAGITVAEAGQKATVLEARASCGGSFKMVAGGFAIAGSDEQKAEGIDDSADILYEDLLSYSGADPEIARAYVDNHLDAYRMLKDEGVTFPRLNTLPCHSKTRSLSVSGLGPKLVKALEDRARRSGVEILFNHRGMRLITDLASGRVLGIEVKVGEETKNFMARRAVILASGGFGRNREMIGEYAPEMVNCIPMMPPSHLGDGL
jgi:fumarate reductase flavoprotein subunit